MARGPVWVSVEQAAAQLRVHPETMRRWIRAGRLEADYVGGKRGYRLRWRLIRAILDADTPNDILSPAQRRNLPAPARMGAAFEKALAAASLKVSELEALGVDQLTARLGL
ncbi:MAG: DNA-binding protein [Dehalococcoidia bacterium]|nr:DNA-binding protein [Dehalococcoidia bacterium]